MSVMVPLIFAFISSLPSLIGILFIKTKKEHLLLLASFATGTFLGSVFLKAFPKLAKLPNLFPYVLLSLIFFMFVEEIIHWHHNHFKKETQTTTKKHIGIINLLGDFFHNFMDGLAIAAAYKSGFGLSFTLAVLAHEIPQEIGDFSVLLYSGFSKKKALILNFLVALSSLIGIIVGYYVQLNPLYFIAFVSGSFLYIAMADLIPLLREEVKGKLRIYSYLAFFTGIFVISLI